MVILVEADEIRRQESISEFLIQNSDDETRIWKFQTLTYCLFSTEYSLRQKDYNGLYGFVKENRSNYDTFDPVNFVDISTIYIDLSRFSLHPSRQFIQPSPNSALLRHSYRPIF